jgi:hypothetical protein
MPHKGHYTQGLAILLRNAVPLRAIEEQLEDFKVVKRIEAFRPWKMSGPALALQLPFPKVSESMGNHDSKIVDAGGVD